jgi:hypothetical protein
VCNSKELTARPATVYTPVVEVSKENGRKFYVNTEDMTAIRQVITEKTGKKIDFQPQKTIL